MRENSHSEEEHEAGTRRRQDTESSRQSGPSSGRVAQTLHLQRLAGNAAVSGLLAGAGALPVQRDKTKADDEAVESEEEG